MPAAASSRKASSELSVTFNRWSLTRNKSTPTADSDRTNVSDMATRLDGGHSIRKPDSGPRLPPRACLLVRYTYRELANRF